ncbi:MAG TPA: hypothetical protein VG245_07675 [Candidatus Dormibacteraeota bacterium]|jgi:hypothetical protein|nr:hypothetical protein [Candidatus Dormibacteraeota bacterium]
MVFQEGTRKALAILAATLPLAACGAATGGPGAGGAASPVPCVSPAPPVIYGANASLNNSHNGRTVCLHVGDVMTVLLRGADPAFALRWSPITASDVTVLKPRGTGALTLARGVTGAMYQAAATGEARLTSSYPPCTQDSVTCDPTTRWSVTVRVVT